jgi:hypothetical protein
MLGGRKSGCAPVDMAILLENQTAVFVDNPENDLIDRSSL